MIQHKRRGKIMELNVGLLIDFGNSQTRATLIKRGESKLYTFDNKFVELPQGYVVPEEYANEKSTIFSSGGVYFANGQIVDREFLGLDEKPSALESKSAQLVTELSARLVIMKMIEALSKEYSTNIENMKITFNIAILLPALEHATLKDDAEKSLVAKIKKITQVQSFAPYNYTCDFTIEKVVAHPEGLTAYFDAFYTKSDTGIIEVPENKEFEHGYNLVLDIGAGTTDIVLILDNEMVLASKETFAIGGNFVSSKVERLIIEKFKFKPTKIEEVVRTCVLREGTTVHLVEDLVNKAKHDYSVTLVKDIKTYLERMNIAMPNVSSVLIVGGGALPAIRDGVEVSPPMAKVAHQYLQKLAPKLKVMHTGDRNLREMNIRGLELLFLYS